MGTRTGVTGAVAGLVLAAGAGRRYGGPKALVDYQGRRLVDRAVETLRGGGCQPVVVVLGAAADQVRAAAELAGCRVTENPQWHTGMGSSLRAGLAALAGPDPARPAPAGSATVAGSEAAGSEAAGPDPVAVVVLLVDLPGMTAPAVRRVAARAAPGALVMACYGAACQPDRHRAGHRLGHPVLLGREHWAGAAALAVGDTGARAYLQAHATTVAVVPCGDVAEDQDLDYPPR